jgi:hypothetical protein
VSKSVKSEKVNGNQAFVDGRWDAPKQPQETPGAIEMTKRRNVSRETICPKCGKKHGRNGRYCHACHAEYMRTWRAERVTLTASEYKRLLMLAQPER